MKSWFALLLITCAPATAAAAVTINEIAWMGSSDSVNHEWIELKNDSATAVSVDGWTLRDGDSLDIALAGSIPGNSYVVLERTSDDSAPGAAFLLYTGALKNSGVTLSLRRGDGGLEDQVAGGENWENIGGDNDTKDTAQYTKGGWVTAQPTPGAANQTNATPQPESSPDSSTSGGTSARLAEPVAREPITLTLPDVTLTLDIVAPKQVFVNQPVDFRVVPSGVGSTIKHSLQYHWNFGDLTTATDKEPTHTYVYPGTYVVQVHAQYGRQEAITDHEITVLPVALSLTQNRSGDVQINNDSPYPVDLSAFRLRAREAIDIPPNTRLLPRQTITVAAPALGATRNQLIALYDQMGQLVDSIMPSTLAAATAEASQSASYRGVVAESSVQGESTNFRFANDEEETEPVVNESNAPIPMYPAPDENPVPTDTTNWPWFALIGLLSLACVVVLVQPFILKDSEKEHE